MDYPRKKRRESYWVFKKDPETGALIVPDRKEFRMVERLEWIAPDGTIYRSLEKEPLDRRRKAIMEEE